MDLSFLPKCAKYPVKNCIQLASEGFHLVSAQSHIVFLKTPVMEERVPLRGGRSGLTHSPVDGSSCRAGSSTTWSGAASSHPAVSP